MRKLVSVIVAFVCLAVLAVSLAVPVHASDGSFDDHVVGGDVQPVVVPSLLFSSIFIVIAAVCAIMLTLLATKTIPFRIHEV